MSTKAERRCEKLGTVLADCLATDCIEEIVRRVDGRASDPMIDAALLHAFALCRSRVELHKRQIARSEASMERIRELMRRTTFQVEETAQ